MNAGDRAFVTGGSGFIGGALISRLARENVVVNALARSETAAAKVEAFGATAIKGDLDDEAALRRGAEGCKYVFHAAAAVADWGDPAYIERLNVAGTIRTLRTAEAAGVERFVHVGTEAALMAGKPLVNVDETAPLRPDSKSLYPSTKARAEQAVRGASTDSFATVVLRPRFVWGPGDTTLLPAMKSMVEAGKFAWVGGGHNLTDTSYIDNVVEGLVLAADKGRGGEAYFVHDGDALEFREMVTKLLATQGVEAPTRSVPKPVAHALSTGGETLWRLLRLKGSPPLTRFAYWVSSQECTIDISKARAELGYEPVISRADGLTALSGR